jgi:hypothetical protein
MFHLGKRAIEEKFTKAELVLLAWRSHEMSHNMEKGTKMSTQPSTRAKSIEGLPPDLPDHFFRTTDDPDAGIKAGELDLRQVTGKEAYRMFQKMGIKLPVIQLSQK